MDCAHVSGRQFGEPGTETIALLLADVPAKPLARIGRGAAKAADIIGLYLNPPENALVLSVDEKPSIQALERATGYVQTSSGKIVQGLKSTYKRHGTVNLFAALEVATGVIRGKTTQTKKRVDFQTFMSEIIEDQGHLRHRPAHGAAVAPRRHRQCQPTVEGDVVPAAARVERHPRNALTRTAGLTAT